MSNTDNNSSSFQPNKKKSLAVSIATVMLFAMVMTFAIYEGTKNTVTMVVNGEEEEVRTHAKTVGEFLAEQEYQVAEHDFLSHSDETVIDGNVAIEWEEAKQYTVNVDGEAIAAWTTDDTVAGILEKAEISLTEHDKVSPALEEQVDADTAISVEKAYEVTILDGSEEKKAWSTSTTVADFLKQQNISLGEFDRIEGEMEELVLPNSEIKVVRVEKVTDVVEDSVKFAVETKKDASLLKGQEKVVQAGEAGLIAKTFEVTKENGKEVKRDLKEEKVVKEPKKQVVAVGTKTIVASVSRGKAPAETTKKPEVKAAPEKKAAPAPKQKAAPAPEKKKAPAVQTVAAPAPAKKAPAAEPAGGKEFYVSATAYTAFCTGCSGITATGINLKDNPGLKVIAVDPSVIPLGSKVWVEGYGNAIAGDTGGAIKGNKIDLFMPERSDALAFGRKQVKVKILN